MFEIFEKKTKGRFLNFQTNDKLPMLQSHNANKVDIDTLNNGVKVVNSDCI